MSSPTQSEEVEKKRGPGPEPWSGPTFRPRAGEGDPAEQPGGGGGGTAWERGENQPRGMILGRKGDIRGQPLDPPAGVEGDLTEQGPQREGSESAKMANTEEETGEEDVQLGQKAEKSHRSSWGAWRGWEALDHVRVLEESPKHSSESRNPGRMSSRGRQATLPH